MVLLEMPHRKPVPVPDVLELVSLFGVQHDGTAEGLDAALQREWYQAGKLRAEIAEHHADKREPAMTLFRRLGFVDEIRVPPQRFIYALLLGATVTAVRKRLAFLRELAHQGDAGISFDRLVMLGSARPLLPDKEGPEALLKPAELPFKPGWSPPSELPRTEAGMMQLVVQQSELSATCRLCQLEFVDTPLQPTPEGKTRNPNTEDTVRHWFNASLPFPGPCLVISSQPYVAHQKLVTQNALGQAFQVVGCGYRAPETLPVTTLLDNVAKLLYEEVRLLH